MAEHDSSYKLLFSHSEMVADLIRGFLHEAWVAELDFATLKGVSGQRRSVRIAYRHPEANATAATGSDVETRFVVSATVRGAYPSDFLGPSESRPHREMHAAMEGIVRPHRSHRLAVRYPLPEAPAAKLAADTVAEFLIGY